MAEVKIVVKNQVEGQNAIPEQAKQWKQLVGGIESAGKMLGAVTAGAAVAWKTIGAGAELDLARKRFENLTASIGTTSDAMMNELGAATGGMMSNAEMIASASQIISLGLGDTQQEVVDLATLTSQLGWDMQQVILTFANDSKMRLDALGLSVTDVEERQKRLEAQGYATSEAFDMAVIEAGQAKLELLGSAADTTAGAMKRIQNVFINTKDAMLGFIAVRSEGAIVGAANVYDAVTNALDDLREAYDLGAITQAEYAKGVLDVTTTYSDGHATLRDARAQLDAINTKTAYYVGMGKLAAESAQLEADALGSLGWSLDMVKANYTGLNQGGFNLFANNLAKQNAEAQRAAEQIESFGWSLDGVKRNYEGLYQSGFRAMSDTLREQEEAARAAGEAFNGYFVTALEDGESIYGKWVTTATAMGGRTEAQEQNFQELSAAAERLRGNIRSLQGGTAGLGLTQDELNEKLAKEYEQLALVEGAMAPLAGITTTYSDVQQKWVVDSDAMTEALYNQIASMSDNAYETAGAAYALGLYDETQLATALNAAITEEKIKNLAQAFADGEISAGDLKTEMDNIVASSPYVTEIDVLTDEAIGNIDKVSSKLAGIPRNITSKISVIADDQSKGAPGGGASDSNRGVVDPGDHYATGGVVPGPVGMPQLAIVHGGEEVLTPAQRATRGGGGNIGGTTIVQNFYNEKAAAIGMAQAERIRRERLDRV